MKKNKIPLSQVIYFIVSMFLIIFRTVTKEDTGSVIQIVNYISMAIAAMGCLFGVAIKTQSGRRKNIYKAICIFILIILVLAGCLIYFCDITLPTALNDVFTLVALMFCLSDKVFEIIIIKLFRLTIDE